jgi:carbon storage regulator CsrA
MLLLSLRVGENILIDHEIQIRILSVSDETSSVSIGIKAPDTVTAQCREVSRKVTDQKPGPIIAQKRRRRTLVSE